MKDLIDRLEEAKNELDKKAWPQCDSSVFTDAITALREQQARIEELNDIVLVGLGDPWWLE